MQVGKNIKIFINYFLGPLLFAWLAYVIVRHLQQQPHIETSWRHIKDSFGSSAIIYFLIGILLMPLNWGLEALKWKMSVSPVVPIRFAQAYKAVLSGVSFSVTMPNRVGEYLGRMMYLPEGNRLRTISVTLIGSCAQLLVTVVMGLIGLVVLRKDLLQVHEQWVIAYQFTVYGLGLAALVLALLYFKIAGGKGLFQQWIRSRRYDYLVEALAYFNMQLLTRILLLSFVRYLVFVSQYILLFYLFGVNIDPATIAAVMSIVFLAMAVIPSIALVELGLRGEISISLMGIYTGNLLGVALTTITVWFINLILPAIIGSLLILNIKVFKRKNEKNQV